MTSSLKVVFFLWIYKFKSFDSNSHADLIVLGFCRVEPRLCPSSGLFISPSPSEQSSLVRPSCLTNKRHYCREKRSFSLKVKLTPHRRSVEARWPLWPLDLIKHNVFAEVKLFDVSLTPPPRVFFFFSFLCFLFCFFFFTFRQRTTYQMLTTEIR